MHVLDAYLYLNLSVYSYTVFFLLFPFLCGIMRKANHRSRVKRVGSLLLILRNGGLETKNGRAASSVFAAAKSGGSVSQL